MKQGFFIIATAATLAALAGCATPPQPEVNTTAAEVRKVAPSCDTLGGTPRCQWIEPPAPVKPVRVPGIEA
jgi:hypothetical protein